MITVNIGGQILLTEHIENYPGYQAISGLELSQKFEEQMKKFSAEQAFGKVQSVGRSGDNFEIILATGDKYQGRALILAFGKIPRSLGVPGEDKFLGKGVSTCAVCDAPLYREKTAVVVGGGNSALEAAEILARFAKKVYIVHRREEFVGDQTTMDRVKANNKIEMILNSAATEVRGEKFVSAVEIENVNTHEKRELKADGLFVEIGYETKTDWVKDFVKLNELGEIIINDKCETSQAGVFAAGDVASSPYKQLVIAAGQGAIAGLSAFNYLQRISGKAQLRGDWGKAR
jgi:thioredoxin reductase (NADPH)